MSAIATLILGASENPERYSYQALVELKKRGHTVYAVGRKPALVQEVPIFTKLSADWKIDTVTLYLNPQQQKDYIAPILLLRPRRIIFNPGTENSELAALARGAGILVQEACTLVLLRTGQYHLQ